MRMADGRRQFPRGWAVALALAVSPALHAAEATDVLDALDGKDYFDANAEISYRAHSKTAKITREDVRNGQGVEVVEFQYVEHSHQVIPRLRVGVFQDIELFAQLPLTVWEQRLGWFHPRNPNAAQNTEKDGYSTFIRDMCLYGGEEGTTGAQPADCEGYPQGGRKSLSDNPGSWPVNHKYETNSAGDPVPGSYTGKDTDWGISSQTDGLNPQFNTIRGLMAYDFSSGFYLFPKGIGDAELGIAFSPYTIGRFNDYRDSAMPSMRIELKYQLPSGYIDTPSPGKAPDKREKLGFVSERKFDPGGVGSGLHRISASIAMSKRLKLFDPYFVARYTLGIPQYYGGIAPERDWRDFGFWSNVAGASMGVEIAPLYYAPTVEEYVNLRVILGLNADYIARHRGSSEMSDALHKWTYVDHYASLLGELGLVLSVPFVTLRALIQAGHETPHFITGDVPGFERDGKDGLSTKEVNPHYNALLDTPGRRVKVTETGVLNGMLTGAITF